MPDVSRQLSPRRPRLLGEAFLRLSVADPTMIAARRLLLGFELSILEPRAVRHSQLKASKE